MECLIEVCSCFTNSMLRLKMEYLFLYNLDLYLIDSLHSLNRRHEGTLCVERLLLAGSKYGKFQVTVIMKVMEEDGILSRSECFHSLDQSWDQTP